MARSVLRMTRVWRGPKGLDDLFRDVGVVAARGGLTLGEHEVIADETGRAVEEFMRYAETAFEELGATTWVRKIFDVKAPPRDAKICIAGLKLRGRGRLAGTFNGKPFSVPARCNNRWYGDWLRFPAPAAVRRGRNELVLRATGSLAWRLFIEPSASPNRSARSFDGGREWNDAHLGKGSFLDGEYVIRLSGRRTAGEGLVTSPPVQVRPDGCGAAPAGRVASLSVALDCRPPVEVRLGRGPWLDRARVWSSWRRPAPAALRAMEQELGAPGPRFVQWRARLAMKGGRAPVVKSAKLTVKLKPAVSCPLPRVRVDGPPTVLPGRHFAHQMKNPCLEAVRRRYKLDRVWARGGDEWESMLFLAGWVGHHASFREPGPYNRGVRYDVVEIIELGHAKKKRVLCGQLAFAFVQLAAAFGHTGRVLLRGNHLVTEMWSPAHRKWAVIDPMDQVWSRKKSKWVWTPGFGGYYHRADGAPVSAIELRGARGRVTRRHLVWKTGRYASRPATEKRDLRWFRREVSWPERNNHTDVYDPVFYADVFRFAGHLKYRRGTEPVMPYYWNYTSRRGDLEWTVGETSAFLTALGEGRLLVQLRSQMPNTAGFRASLGGAAPCLSECDSLEWKPASTGSELSVRAANTLGVEGPVTTCRAVEAR